MLHPTIKSCLSVLEVTMYLDLVDRAIIAERDLVESQVSRDKKDKYNN